MPAHLRGIGRRLSLLARPRGAEALPIVLDRRRIYVLPTRFGLFITALVLAMLLGALNYNNNPALLLALLLATSAIASSIMAHLQLSALRIEAVSAEPVVAGQALRMRVSLARRDTRMRRGLRLDHLDSSSFCSLVEHDMAEVDLLVPTEQRGWQDIERIRLSSTQPLGLVRAWSWVWPETPLLAYPKPEEQGPPLPDAARSPNQTCVHAQGEELHQLRQYRAGDAPRAISWKHSARHDTLLVREYEKPLEIEVTLDWRALNTLPYEYRIARLAHWVNLAERDGHRYRLLLPSQPPLGPAQGPLHHHLCQRALALLSHG